MNHFELGQWADLVRGLANDRIREVMDAHLSSGCLKCRKTVDFLRKVLAAAGAEAEYEVPEYAVNCARAIHALQKPGKVYILPRIVGRLIYDSFKEPLPAGSRARHRITRHALYRAADYSIDLRLEYQRGTPNVSLVGQITSQKDRNKPLEKLPVFLASGKKVVARAFSNAFGEFQIEYEPTQNLRLYIQASQRLQKRIEVPLNRVSPRDTPRRTSLSKPRKKRG